MVHHSNTSNPARCLVRLFSVYLNHCPKDRKSTAFYLTPLKKPKDDIWYSITPLGHNTLSSTVKRLCQAGGITGFKTNHSLHVTNATRLFQSGVDEQLISLELGTAVLMGYVCTRGFVRNRNKRCLPFLTEQQTRKELKVATKNASADIQLPEEFIVPNTTAQLVATSAALSAVSSFAPTMNISGCGNVSITYSFNKKE